MNGASDAHVQTPLYTKEPSFPPHHDSILLLAVFDTYQKARLTFVQTVADLSSRPQNVGQLQEAGVMALLRPLLLDTGASYHTLLHNRIDICVVIKT